jgi:hypothetical protein
MQKCFSSGTWIHILFKWHCLSLTVKVEQRYVPAYLHLEESLLRTVAWIHIFFHMFLLAYFVYSLLTAWLLNIYIFQLFGLKKYFYSTQQLTPSPGTKTNLTNQNEQPVNRNEDFVSGKTNKHTSPLQWQRKIATWHYLYIIRT